MKIFGREFKTRKELKDNIDVLENDVTMLNSDIVMLKDESTMLKDELKAMRAAFPFDIGQTVYDVQFRNNKGRYTKNNASLEHSRINKVVVDEKNYFGLVERYRCQDVFLDYYTADAFLVDVCTKKS